MSRAKETLEIGSRINIKRSNGRIHTAFVGSINYDIGSASVEWFEQGETKGKEIDLLLIEALNPDIRIVRPTNHAIEQQELRQTEEPIVIIDDSSGTSDEETSAVMAQSQKLEESDDDYNSNMFSADTATLSDDLPLGRHTVALQPSPTQYHIASNGHIPTIAASGSTVPKDRERDHMRMQDYPINSSGRRTNVVKEVEKLKKNREERRQRQAEEKAEKEAFLQMNPENPHWELYSKIQEYRRTLDIKPLSDSDAIEDHLITVCVRKRPLNRKEINRKEVDVITIPSKNQLIVHEPKNKVDLTKYLENQLFRFDYAFDETCSNEMVYRYTAQPLIKTIFDGGFATCFAYGQTGSGKTHTMGGSFNGKTQNCHQGIYAYVTADVFKLITDPKYRHLRLAVSSSFFEIYSGKVFDLLNNKAKLRILEDGKQQVQVVGLSEIAVHSTEEVLKLIQKGSQARTSGQTFANNNSSRSHAVFQIYLRSMTAPDKIHGKFSLIDLAGNERGADTSSANRQTRMEGAEINKSLLALKECIRALARKGAHLPFRVSKLTQVLRDSFVGSNSRTCMIAMVSPGVSSCEHTLNTLRYADRVKELGGGDLPTAQLSDDQDNADLVQLQSLNEAEMSPELLNLHQVISELQVAEDIMLDNCKQVAVDFMTFSEKANKIVQSAESVTYDQEALCNNFIDLVNNAMNVLQRSKETAEDFKAKLLAEEQLSCVTKRKKNARH